jgi:hypothetical protein
MWVQIAPGKMKWLEEREALEQLCDEVVANYTAAIRTSLNAAEAEAPGGTHACPTDVRSAAERLLTHRCLKSLGADEAGDASDRILNVFTPGNKERVTSLLKKNGFSNRTEVFSVIFDAVQRCFGEESTCMEQMAQQYLKAHNACNLQYVGTNSYFVDMFYQNATHSCTPGCFEALAEMTKSDCFLPTYAWTKLATEMGEQWSLFRYKKRTMFHFREESFPSAESSVFWTANTDPHNASTVFTYAQIMEWSGGALPVPECSIFCRMFHHLF